MGRLIDSDEVELMYNKHPNIPIDGVIQLCDTKFSKIDVIEKIEDYFRGCEEFYSGHNTDFKSIKESMISYIKNGRI